MPALVVFTPQKVLCMPVMVQLTISSGEEMVTKPSPCSHKLINKAERGVAEDKQKTKKHLCQEWWVNKSRGREGRWELGAVLSVS